MPRWAVPRTTLSLYRRVSHFWRLQRDGGNALCSPSATGSSKSVQHNAPKKQWIDTPATSICLSLGQLTNCDKVALKTSRGIEYMKYWKLNKTKRPNAWANLISKCSEMFAACSFSRLDGQLKSGWQTPQLNCLLEKKHDTEQLMSFFITSERSCSCYGWDCPLPTFTRSSRVERRLEQGCGEWNPLL